MRLGGKAASEYTTPLTIQTSPSPSTASTDTSSEIGSAFNSPTQGLYLIHKFCLQTIFFFTSCFWPTSDTIFFFPVIVQDNCICFCFFSRLELGFRTKQPQPRSALTLRYVTPPSIIFVFAKKRIFKRYFPNETRFELPNVFFQGDHKAVAPGRDAFLWNLLSRNPVLISIRQKCKNRIQVAKRRLRRTGRARTPRKSGNHPLQRYAAPPLATPLSSSNLPTLSRLKTFWPYWRT